MTTDRMQRQAILADIFREYFLCITLHHDQNRIQLHFTRRRIRIVLHNSLYFYQPAFNHKIEELELADPVLRPALRLHHAALAPGPPGAALAARAPIRPARRGRGTRAAWQSRRRVHARRRLVPASRPKADVVRLSTVRHGFFTWRGAQTAGGGWPVSQKHAAKRAGASGANRLLFTIFIIIFCLSLIQGPIFLLSGVPL